jgi:hypothetical protein
MDDGASKLLNLSHKQQAKFAHQCGKGIPNSRIEHQRIWIANPSI